MVPRLRVVHLILKQN